MAEILIAYLTKDGQTRKVAERLKKAIEQQPEHRVTLASIREQPDFDIKPFDLVVLGASVRYGTHGKPMQAFVEKNATVLESKNNAFFSVNLVARKAEKRTAETNAYVKKFLTLAPWKPKQLGIFAGKLDYPSYHFWDRWMIQMIMKMTDGPTDPKTVLEYTDWDAVDAFGRALADSAKPAKVPAAA
jgi:menaquinone-dependent protoporphyrinogen oxidase